MLSTVASNVVGFAGAGPVVQVHFLANPCCSKSAHTSPWEGGALSPPGWSWAAVVDGSARGGSLSESASTAAEWLPLRLVGPGLAETDLDLFFDLFR